MPDDQREVSVRELRANLADELHRVSVLHEPVYVTSRGRRIAVIRPVAEQPEER